MGNGCVFLLSRLAGENPTDAVPILASHVIVDDLRRQAGSYTGVRSAASVSVAFNRVQKSISPSVPKDLSQPHLKAVINAHSS
jgi:hypothetical protein